MSARFVSQAVLGVLVLSLLGAGVAWLFLGLPAFLLGLASGALGLVIVLMWGSLQQMEESDEMEFEQALSYAAPSVEEEQKRALLRTLKDLEYELSVGKISREDYDQIYAEVAEKAKRMIALTDEAMKARILKAEERVTARLAKSDAKTKLDDAEREAKLESKSDVTPPEPAQVAEDQVAEGQAAEDQAADSEARS